MSPPTDLSCKELVELITHYLERALPPADVTRFEAHLDLCRGCRRYVEQMRQTVAALGTLTEESLPEDAKQSLLRAFRDWKKNHQPG